MDGAPAQLPRLVPASGDPRAAGTLVNSDLISRAARELVAAYGAAAGRLMRQRTLDVSRRGDAESAFLWQAIAAAIEREVEVSGRAGDIVGADVPISKLHR